MIILNKEYILVNGVFMSISEITYGSNNHIPNNIIFSGAKIDGYIQEHNTENAIYTIKSSLNTKDNVKIASNSNIDGIILDYNLKGVGTYKSEIFNYKVNLLENHLNIAIMKDERGISFVPKGVFKKVNLVIKKDFLEKNIPNGKFKDEILNKIEKNTCTKLLSNKKINYQKQLLLNDLFLSPFNEQLNNILIQSKVLEIVFLELNDLFVSDTAILNTNTLKLDELDINAIKKAKDILIRKYTKSTKYNQTFKVSCIK